MYECAWGAQSDGRRYSVAAINEVVIAYIEAVASELPGSIPLSAGSDQSHGDDKLARLVDLKRYGSPLRLCTPRQALALVLAIMGRVAEPETHEGRMGLRLVVGCRPREMRTAEVAQEIGLTLSQTQREITMARHMVSAALEENARTRRRIV